MTNIKTAMSTADKRIVEAQMLDVMFVTFNHSNGTELVILPAVKMHTKGILLTFKVNFTNNVFSFDTEIIWLWLNLLFGSQKQII